MSFFKKVFDFIKGLSKCKHVFTISDVVNLKVDPKCVNCGKPLSVCKSEIKKYCKYEGCNNEIHNKFCEYCKDHCPREFYFDILED